MFTSEFERSKINSQLYKHGVNVPLIPSYHAFANEIKGGKIQTKDDIEKLIEKRKQEGLNEELLKKIAKIVRPA